MAERVPLDKSDEFVVKGQPDELIRTSVSDISVGFRGPDGVEHENIHSDATTSNIIALSTAADLNLPPTPTYQEKFVEQLDSVKANPYLSEVEIEFKAVEFGWPPSVGSIRIWLRRGLNKVTKSYKKEGK